MTPPTRREAAIARWVAAIVLLAALLRLYPIWFGLPYPEARPDEETAIAHAARILSGDLNPHFFHWPSFALYVFALAVGAAAGAARAMTGASLTYADQVLVCRAVVAAAGTSTVLVLYHLGRRTGGPVVGALAALFLSVSLLAVRESHFAMTDVLMTLLAVAALACLARALDEGEDTGSRWFAWAGLAAGLAVSTKYSAAALAAAMIAAQVIAIRRAPRAHWSARLLRPSMLFGATCLGGFLAGTPYALLDVPAFRADLAFDFVHLSGAHEGIDAGRGWTSHLLRSLSYGAGIAMAAAALGGLMRAVRHRQPGAILIGAFAAAVYLAIGAGRTVFVRYALPIVPVLCVYAAMGVEAAAQAWAGRARLVPARVLLVAIVAGPALLSSVQFDRLLAETDTRVLASAWLAGCLQPADRLYDAGNDYTRLRFPDAARRQEPYDAVARAFPALAGRLPEWIVLFDSPLGAYVRAPAGVRELAVRRYRPVRTEIGVMQPDVGANYDVQDAFFVPLSDFSAVARPGPTVLIYRRADLPDPPGCAAR